MLNVEKRCRKAPLFLFFRASPADDRWVILWKKRYDKRKIFCKGKKRRVHECRRHDDVWGAA